MKHTITFLKAPWPAAAKVGDVVQFPGGVVPGWALGKCVQAVDDAAVAFEIAQPESAASEVDDLRAKLAAADAEAKAQAQARAEAEAERDDLRAKLAAAEQKAASGKTK